MTWAVVLFFAALAQFVLAGVQWRSGNKSWAGDKIVLGFLLLSAAADALIKADKKGGAT